MAAAKRDNSPRRRTYIWVTWLTKLLAGENKCWWATWFRANHDYAKTPDIACAACKPGGSGGPCEDPDNCRVSFFKRFNERHDALVLAHAAKLKTAGYVVKIEDDGAFKLSGTNADVAGKPDLVALGPDGTATVIDGKSGRRRDSDHWQVLIYQFALPLTWLRGHQIRGQVLYAEGAPVEVRPLNAPEREAIVQAIKRVTDRQNPPPATPSRNECRYCDVAACPLRFKEEPVAEGDGSEYF